MKLFIKLLGIGFLSFSLLAIDLRFTHAKEDELEDEHEAEVDSDEPVQEAVVTGTEGNETPDVKDTGSVNADIYLLFTKPTFPSTSNIGMLKYWYAQMQTELPDCELPAGKQVEFLVGFTNKGSLEFTIETLDASFRYPMDFTYHIQNFSTIQYDRTVPPGYQATLSYAFIPADSFAGRPFGLSINLAYKDEFGAQFYEKVYNETVNIVEVEEGLDGETFFLYVFLGAGVLLLLVISQQFLYSVGKKRVGGAGKKQNPQLEIGTTKKNDIDYDWVPPHLLKNFGNKSPKVTKNNKSPNTKHRKVK